MEVGTDSFAAFDDACLQISPSERLLMNYFVFTITSLLNLEILNRTGHKKI